jgi:transposase
VPHVVGMVHVDMRKLPAAAQEERRRQVVGLRESGLTFAAIAAQTGLTENGVSGICRRYAERGMAGLVTGPRGPAVGTGRFLSAQQEVQALIYQHLPDALGLPYALWSRAAVRDLVAQRHGVRLAVRSTGRYLARWNFTAQKPLRRAYEQSAAAVQHWLRQDYPAIRAQAKREKGAVFWGDETGLRSDDVRGRSYAPRGHTPVVRPSHRRASVGLISAVTNKGELRWMVLDGAIKAPVLIRFMQRLVRDAGCKVFLILDNLPVHRARLVQGWLAERRAEIELFYLPS